MIDSVCVWDEGTEGNSGNMLQRAKTADNDNSDNRDMSVATQQEIIENLTAQLLAKWRTRWQR